MTTELVPRSSMVPSSSVQALDELVLRDNESETSHWQIKTTDEGVPHSSPVVDSTRSPSVASRIIHEPITDAHSHALTLEREESIRCAIHEQSMSRIDADDSGDASVLTWHDLCITTKAQPPRYILDHVTGSLQGGHLVAIMGPSGSGKSTLLNALAHRLDRNTDMTGQVYLFGRPYTTAQLKAVSGYVMQDDLLNGHLTVEETLIYTAHLRLSPDLTLEEKEQRVDEVIKQLGLQGCRHTIIGSPLRKGISGGQRKRVCVAMELLPKPSVLFLDEPTSGLDSVTALSLIQLLKELTDTVGADGHRFTVVWYLHRGTCIAHDIHRYVTLIFFLACDVMSHVRDVCVSTIHQPQSRIFDLFDDLIILKAGKLVFGGSTAAALNAWRKAGLPVPDGANPADHLLESISPPLEATTGLPVPTDEPNEEKIKLSYRPRQPSREFVVVVDQDGNGQGEAPILKARQRLPWHRQFWTLFLRHGREQSRRKGLFMVQLIQTVVMAVLIGTSFFRIGTGQSSTVRRQPVLFFCVINQGVFGSLAVINSFPAERLLTLRERAAGTYNVSAYFMAKVLAETIAGFICPTIFGATVYFLIGLQPVAGKFFEFIAFMILCSTAANSLALFISALCRTTNVAVNVLPLTMELARLYGGFFLSPKNLPTYFSWLDAISYVKYAYTGISLSELYGLKLDCGTTPIDKCIPDGETTIKTLGLDYLTQAQCAGILISYIVILRFMAYLAVRFIKW